MMRADMLSDSIKWQMDDIKYELISQIKEQYLKYPKTVIKNLVAHQKTIKDKPVKILFSMTTCKRFDLFEKTMNSFLNGCQDATLIDKWI